MGNSTSKPINKPLAMQMLDEAQRLRAQRLAYERAEQRERELENERESTRNAPEQWVKDNIALIFGEIDRNLKRLFINGTAPVLVGLKEFVESRWNSDAQTDTPPHLYVLSCYELHISDEWPAESLVSCEMGDCIPCYSFFSFFSYCDTPWENPSGWKIRQLTSENFLKEIEKRCRDFTNNLPEFKDFPLLVHFKTIAKTEFFSKPDPLDPLREKIERESSYDLCFYVGFDCSSYLKQSTCCCL